MFEELAIITGCGIRISEGAFIGVVVKVGRIGGSGRFVGFAEMIGGAASGEVIHPGGEVSLIPVGVPVFEHALEDDLGDVLRGRAITGVFSEEAKKRSVVFFEEFSERVEVALAHGEHQFMVRLEGGLIQGRSAVGVSRGQSSGNTKI